MKTIIWSFLVPQYATYWLLAYNVAIHLWHMGKNVLTTQLDHVKFKTNFCFFLIQ